MRVDREDRGARSEAGGGPPRPGRAPGDRGAGDGEVETIRSDAASPEDAAHERQMLRLLLEVVDGLPPIYREVVRLRDIEERSEKETAARLDLSGSGVASRLHRAHRLVGDRLRRRIGRPGR